MDIIAVTDRKNCARPLTEQAELICSAGADMIVMREKDLSRTESLRMAAELMGICAGSRTEFCIDGKPEIASEMGIETLWMPFGRIGSGMPDARKIIVSVHSFAEGKEAAAAGADAVVYGNVFETRCKPGKPAMGLETVSLLASELEIPVWAIGGIGPGNIRRAFLSGASGACLMSGLMAAADPEITVSACRAACQNL